MVIALMLILYFKKHISFVMSQQSNIIVMSSNSNAVLMFRFSLSAQQRVKDVYQLFTVLLLLNYS